MNSNRRDVYASRAVGNPSHTAVRDGLAQRENLRQIKVEQAVANKTFSVKMGSRFLVPNATCITMRKLGEKLSG
jgi:hypothetical protein